MAINKKANALFLLMERFLIQKEISAYDPNLLEELKCSYRTLERYLNDIASLYSHIITIKKSRKKVWKLVNVSDIFKEFLKNREDIFRLFLMAQEFDNSILKELENGTLSKLAQNDKSIFLFKNSIMETIKTDKEKSIFRNLKLAIANYEYRNITYTYNDTTTEEDVKCLKLVFMDNNWYLALVDKEGILKFKRLSFIDNVEYSKKNNFSKKEILPYLDFLKKAQNSMSLYGVEPKKAVIKATPEISKYFKKDMKRFLSSQKFERECEDGGVIFTLEYTQELEILPFIQKWLPDLIILEPEELKEAYLEKLKKAIKNHK